MMTKTDVLGYDEFEALFLNSGDPIVEAIQESTSYPDAWVAAIDWLVVEKVDLRSVTLANLVNMVLKFRSQ